MDAKILALHSSIRRDLEIIADLYSALDQHPLTADADEDALILIAYRLHNLYGVFENILWNIAIVFENSVDDQARWHAQLLQRMCLNLMPVRPAVIDDAMYDALDELRRFRHLLRHNYSITLDPMRLRVVLHKAEELRELYPVQMETFMSFLEGLM